MIKLTSLFVEFRFERPSNTHLSQDWITLDSCWLYIMLFRALSYYSDMTLSQKFQPMAAQLSIKAALPLATILATASCRSSKTGPRLDNVYSYTEIGCLPDTIVVGCLWKKMRWASQRCVARLGVKDQPVVVALIAQYHIYVHKKDTIRVWIRFVLSDLYTIVSNNPEILFMMSFYCTTAKERLASSKKSCCINSAKFI